MPYVNNLVHRPEVSYVAFVAPYIDIDERIVMGWNSAENMTDEAVRFFIAPTDDAVEALLQEVAGPDTHCIFSGINAFEQVAKWLKMSLKYNVHRSILTEPPMIYEHPLWMHALRFAICDWSLVKYIDNMLVMGDRFVPYYKMWSRHWNVYPFMYCTNLKDVNTMPLPLNTDLLNVVYVGELCRRKNVLLLLQAMAAMPNVNNLMHIDIVGDGSEMSMLQQFAEQHSLNVTFHGRQPMNQIAHFICRNDVLVLPSCHDGWGAVVNEALSLGRFVLCSDHCGARYLINKLSAWNSTLGCICGRVFRSNKKSDLQQNLLFCIENKQLIRQTTNERINWSKDTISSSAVAQRMIDILTNKLK